MAASSIIRVERDPAFWLDLLRHPDVAKAMRGFDPSVSIDRVVANLSVIPVASENGGYLFVRMDPFGFVWDLHAAYTPEARRGEAGDALKAALDLVNFQMITVFETEDPQSRPPLSFGFRKLFEPQETAIGPVAMWTLTREAWEASKARARMH